MPLKFGAYFFLFSLSTALILSPAQADSIRSHTLAPESKIDEIDFQSALDFIQQHRQTDMKDMDALIKVWTQLNAQVHTQERGYLEDLYNNLTALLEKLVVGTEFDARFMNMYHAAHRWWESVCIAKGWDSGERHFLVVVPTFNRPKSLRRLLESVEAELNVFGYGGKKNGVWQKVRILLLDDSNDAEKITENGLVVENMRRRGLRIDCWGEKRQKQLISELDAHTKGMRAERFVMKSHQALNNPNELVFADKGYAGVRNMARLATIRALADMPERTLVVHWDDDMEVAKLVTKKGFLAKEHFVNFFATVDKAFATDRRMLVMGGGYTMDSNDGYKGLIPAMEKLVALLGKISDSMLAQPYRGEFLEGFRLREGSRSGTMEGALAEVLKEVTAFRGGKYSNLNEIYRPERDLAQHAVPVSFESPAFHAMALGGNIVMRPEIVACQLPYFDLPRGEDVFFLQLLDMLYPGSLYYNPNISLIHNRTPAERPDLYAEAMKHFQTVLILTYLSNAIKYGIPDTTIFRNEGIAVLQRFVHSNRFFDEKSKKAFAKAQSKTFGAQLRGELEKIGDLARFVEEHTKNAEHGSWWIVSKPLRDARDSLKTLAKFLKRFEWDDKVEHDFLERSADTFEIYMQRFTRCVDGLHEWKLLVATLQAASLSSPSLEDRLYADERVVMAL